MLYSNTTAPMTAKNLISPATRDGTGALRAYLPTRGDASVAGALSVRFIAFARCSSKVRGLGISNALCLMRGLLHAAASSAMLGTLVISG